MLMPPAMPAAASVTGRAAVLDRFGGAEQIRLSTRAWSLKVSADQTIIRNFATSVNPIEWKMREGLGLPRPLWRRLLGSPMVLGMDFAGEVIAAGPISGFQPGNRVMGALPLRGAYADYVSVQNGGRGAVTRLPDGIDPNLGALLPFAGLVALAGLSQFSLSGRHVLIIGATGGVGHLAVQIACAMGAASVAAICAHANAGFARQLGADDVLPHDTLQDPAEITTVRPDWRERFDLILDTSGMDAYYIEAAPGLLSNSGRFVAVALPALADGRPGEAAGPIEAARLAAKLLRRRMGGRYRLITGLLGGIGGSAELGQLARWMASGQVVPHAGATFTLDRISDAHRLIERGGIRGKISVSLEAGTPSHA